MNLNRVKTYCGEPTEVERAGYIYPVRLLEWEVFLPLANKFLMTSDLFLRRRLSLSENIKLFDFITINAVISSEDGYSGLKEMEHLFSIVFRTEVKVGMRGKVSEQEIYFVVDKKGIIDRDNYDEVRKTIMEQNLMFDPVVAKNEKSQKIIDRAITKLHENKNPMDMEAMVVAVSTFKKINISEITYYQLRADYEMFSKIEQNRAIPIYRANGAKFDLINLTDEMDIHKNPYGMDVLFRKRDDNQMMEKLKR